VFCIIFSFTNIYYIASGIPISEDCIEFFMKSVHEENYKVSVYVSRLLWKIKKCEINLWKALSV